MDLRSDFYYEMISIRFELYYIHYYIKESYLYNNILFIVTAITSSSSVCAWTIWATLHWVWAAIIMLSQLINCLKAIFPYNDRFKYLGGLHSELSSLFKEYEHTWYDIQDDTMKNMDIKDKLKELDDKKQEILGNYLNSNYLPDKKKYKNKALEDTINYSSRYNNSKC